MSDCTCPGCKHRTRETDRKELCRLADLLNDDERAVLINVAEGLVKGVSTYGPLDVNKEARSMHKETYEEIRDALVYVGVKLVQLERQ